MDNSLSSDLFSTTALSINCLSDRFIPSVGGISSSEAPQPRSLRLPQLTAGNSHLYGLVVLFSAGLPPKVAHHLSNGAKRIN